jgi:hypothetical protein
VAAGPFPPAPGSPAPWMGPPPWAAPSGPPPPPDLRPSVQLARDGVRLYRAVLALSLLAEVVSIAAALADPSVGAQLALSTGGLPTSSATPANLPGWYGGVEALIALLALVGLLLGIVAFLRWRSAVKGLGGVGASGPGFAGGAQPAPAEAARQGYVRSLLVLLSAVLAIVIGVIVLAVIVVSHLPARSANNTTGFSSAQVHAAVASTYPEVIGLAVVVLALELLLAYFVTRSLNGFLGLVPIASPRIDPEQLPALVLVGVALSGTGLLGEISPALEVLPLLGTGLVLYAAVRYARAFEDRLIARPGPIGTGAFPGG